MSSFPNDPFYLFQRMGTRDNPFKGYYESKVVFNGTVILTEIPHKDDHVIVKYGTTPFGEVLAQSSLTSDNVYYVDYDSGMVYFDQIHNGKELSFQFNGEGYFNIPASRIFTQSVDDSPSQNLQDMIDNYNQLNGTDLYTLFDPQNGHQHTGAPGDAPAIQAQHIPINDVDNIIDSLDVENALQEHANHLIDSDKAIGVNIEFFPRLSPEIVDDPRILRALNTMQNGGVLVLNGDTYMVGSQDISIPYDNISIIGKGKATTFKLANNLTLSNGVIYVNGKSGFTLMNLAIDGNNVNQTNTSHMVRLSNTDQATVSNVHFQNVYGNCLTFSGSTNFFINHIFATNVTGTNGDPGEVLYAQGAKQGTINNVIGTNISDHLVYLDAGSDGSTSSDILMENMIGVICGVAALTTGATYNIVNDCQRFKLVNCSSINSRTGFYFHENGTTNQSPSDYTLVNCTAVGSTFAAGFYFQGANPSPQTKTNGKIVGCTSKGNVGTTSSFGYRFQDLNGFTISNCDAIGNGANGFIFQNVSNVDWDGGKILNNGQTSSMQGVKIGGDNTQTCQNFQVRGINSSDDQTTKTQTDGLDVLAGCTNIIIKGGSFIGNINNQVFLNDPSVGEYLADTPGAKSAIQFSIAANSGNGTVNYIRGSEYVTSITSSSNGVFIELENLPWECIPVVIPYDMDSNGFGTSGSQIGFIYTRTASASSVELGFKVSASGSHVPLNTLNVGSKGFTILF